jgi:hypothetical protein
MREFGAAARSNARVYLTGGATAVLLGWRETTVDIDISVVPELDELFRSIPSLKERLGINVELASPADFIPELPGWDTRSEFIRREGRIDFFNYDIYSQALAKIERGHSQDRLDVDSMLSEGLIERPKLREMFEAIRPSLHRYPAIDPETFAKLVEQAVGEKGDD